MTILDRITETTRRTVAEAKRATSRAELEKKPLFAAPRRDFAEALRRGRRAEVPALIAEVKRASPSQGVIRADFDPVAIATAYRNAGASAISVLTDAPYFQGHLDYLKTVREAVEDCPPLLRKDFVIDPYQLHEARAYGADAVLLIVSILTDAELGTLLEGCRALELTALVEAYSLEEVHRALAQDIEVLGINNRDLRDFSVDLQRTAAASRAVQQHRRRVGILLVSESGITSVKDARRVRSWGADAMLVGESLMRQPDVEVATCALLGGEPG